MKRGCLYCYSGNIDKAIEVFRGLYSNVRWVTSKEMKRKYKTAEISIEFQGRDIRMKLDYELFQPKEMIS